MYIFFYLKGKRYDFKKNNKNENNDQSEVTEEDEGYDIVAGKIRKENRLNICYELCKLISPFAQSKHLKSENDYNISKFSKYVYFFFIN